jgi:L-alanine-DL-glutamate epimerase-like enolase superfamily enzyme
VRIESVEFYYLSLPVVRDIGDGSQDALLVKICAGNHVGWGECEAAPLPSMASWNCPMSHSACKPISASVLGQPIDSPDDIRRINATVRANSFDLLQTDHTLSGIDVALWDLLGKHRGEPVHRLLGYSKAHPRIAYASELFGDDPQKTFDAARAIAARGFVAAKFGWGPYGRHSVSADAEQVHAARDGLGTDRLLLVDAGTVWGDDVASAAARLAALEECKVHWLEEPFETGALTAYSELSERCASVKLAGGEGCHNLHQGRNMVDHAGIGFLQIDTGRVGGITTATLLAGYAHERGVQFVNHTFTTSLALSASLQPYAGLEGHSLCEFPSAPSVLAQELTLTSIHPNSAGMIHLPEGPGLGVEPDPAAIRKYLLDVEIKVGGRVILKSPAG